DVEVGPRERGGGFESRWRVSARDELGPIETTYHFLLWDDLIRARWARSILGVYGNIWRAFWPLLFHGVFLHMRMTSWPILITLFYPVGFMLLHVLIALLAGGLAGYAVSLALGPIAGLVAGLVAAASLFTFGRRLEERYNALWLGRIGMFFADQGRG